MMKSTPVKTSYYDILGLSPWASGQDIRQAYREKSKLYHPDTTRLPLGIAREKFEQLNQAYSILSSSQLRQQYDLSLRAGATPPSPQPKPVTWGLGLNVSIRERPLSAGEIFALFILGLTFLGCLVLAVVVGFSRGELMIQAWS